MDTLNLGGISLNLGLVQKYIFDPQQKSKIDIEDSQKEIIKKGHQNFLNLFEKNIPIYGVTTGFGDSSFRVISKYKSEELQSNLISYLICGTGAKLPKEVSKSILLFRMHSLSRGYSGVSEELLNCMSTFLENDWIPVIPSQGSLGASGDLVPLAYLAFALQGKGDIDTPQGRRPAKEVLQEANMKPYVLKAKEGLAIVNGTAAMAGIAFYNFCHLSNLLSLAEMGSAWTCLALSGRTESFGELVNKKAKFFPGQYKAAKNILNLLKEESYLSPSLTEHSGKSTEMNHHIQDKYSLRCAPQILGPIHDTFDMFRNWLTSEINSVSDNPLIDEDGSLAMGGNFYGGYIGHGMDYIKICLGHMADIIDRQLMTVVDEKSNKGLPANLVDWENLPEEEAYLHHGLKGINQATSAITSEIMAKCMPNTLFSRSAESHNQDKVSLGTSAAVQCMELIDPMYSIISFHLITLAQAIDIKKIKLKGSASLKIYNTVRAHVPFISKDVDLDKKIEALKADLIQQSLAGEEIFNNATS